MSLIEFTATLEKIGPEKGSWTVAFLPEGTSTEGFANRGMFRKAKGTIDGQAFKGITLVPVGDGRIFVPVRAEIRKAIGKKDGQQVAICLVPDTDPLLVPDDLTETLALFPKAKAFFDGLTESQQGYFVKWVEEAKHVDTRQARLEKCLDMLEAGRKMYEPREQ